MLRKHYEFAATRCKINSATTYYVMLCMDVANGRTRPHLTCFGHVAILIGTFEK